MHNCMFLSADVAITVSLWCVKSLSLKCLIPSSGILMAVVMDGHLDIPIRLLSRCTAELAEVALPLSYIDLKPAQCSGESRPLKDIYSNSLQVTRVLMEQWGLSTWDYFANIIRGFASASYNSPSSETLLHTLLLRVAFNHKTVASKN